MKCIYSAVQSCAFLNSEQECEHPLLAGCPKKTSGEEIENLKREIAILEERLINAEYENKERSIYSKERSIVFMNRIINAKRNNKRTMTYLQEMDKIVDEFLKGVADKPCQP